MNIGQMIIGYIFASMEQKQSSFVLVVVFSARFVIKSL